MKKQPLIEKKKSRSKNLPIRSVLNGQTQLSLN